ncbi:MAG TPA: tetratricopeptide repeat protein [Flavisolibacter sp.]|nr:tetratricopeptide repeat protein [Flavisolibacter sp.]
MKRKLLLQLSLVLCFFASAQQNPAVVDSMKVKLSKAKPGKERIELLGRLARVMMTTNQEEAEKYANQMSQEAEMSRDRKLMARAMIINADRFSYFYYDRAKLQRSVTNYSAALAFAKQNQLDKETVQSLIGLSSVYNNIPELDKSLNCVNQAFGIVSGMNDDTLKVSVYNSFGLIYQLKKERILALQNYLNALRIAEEEKDANMLRSCYSNLARFYGDMKDYDKAIDYYQRAMDQLPLAKLENEKYVRVVDMYTMGNLYMLKKDRNMSVFYYERSIKMADSLNYPTLKMPGYDGMLGQYLDASPDKALEFLNSRSDLREYAAKFGSGHMVNNAYGIIYKKLGKYDSAAYYFAQAAPGFESNSTPSAKLGFYYQFADFQSRSGNTEKAIDYFNRSMMLAQQTGDLESQEMIAKEMDSVYAKAGDFKQSAHYKGVYYQLRDSLQKLGQERELLQMEIEDEQQRQARIDRENAEKLRAKHNIQYMGITVGIAVVFLFLVLLGIFQVSETTIKVMGFFAFILLFEFIILIADSRIHHWTHGEPLPILGIKIVLIAMLLPLHHWLEHKVVNYLTSKRLIIPTSKGIWKKIRMRREEPTQHV